MTTAKPYTVTQIGTIAMPDMIQVEIFLVNGNPVYVDPITKEILPAPLGSKAGQRVEVPRRW